MRTQKLAIFVLAITTAATVGAQEPVNPSQAPAAGVQPGSSANQIPANSPPEVAAPQAPAMRNGFQILDFSAFAAYYSHALGNRSVGVGLLPSDEAAAIVGTCRQRSPYPARVKSRDAIPRRAQ